MHASTRLALWAAIGLLAAPTVTVAASLNQSASAGYTYFYRPGASMRTHDEDVTTCRTLSSATVQPGHAAYLATTDPYASSGFWERMQNAGQSENRLGREVNLDNCMVVKGWRIVAVDVATGTALAAQSRARRLAEIAGWVGAEQPHGVIVRRFDNEALDTATSMFTAASPQSQRLDVDPLPPSTADFVRLDPDDPTATSTAPYAIPRPKPLRSEPVRPPSSTSGLIAIALLGSGSDIGGFRLVFERVDAKGAPFDDKKTAEFTVAQSQLKTAGPLRIFAVPAGHWRIAAVAQGPYMVNFCFGAPAFYVAPGAVVYAGAFDPHAPSRSPVMDLAAARAALSPDSPVAAMMRPADWRNGSVGRCRGAYIYALEFPGRPFVDDYHLGSLAAADEH